MATTIPSAESVYMSRTNVPPVVQVKLEEKADLTPEQLKEKAEFRLDQLKRAVTFTENFIISRSGQKITVRAKKFGQQLPPTVATDIFKFSLPALVRGAKTNYYSYVCVNGESGQCSFESFRPLKHSPILWFFPLNYLMSGFHGNAERTFQQLGLVSVFEKLNAEFPAKGYRVNVHKNKFCECASNNACTRCRIVTLFWSNNASTITKTQ